MATSSRQRNLLIAVAVVLGVVLLNAIFTQPWHVTVVHLVISVALGAGTGLGVVMTDDVLKWLRKGRP